MQRLIFDAEHESFRESARRFYQREVAPHGERCASRAAWTVTCFARPASRVTC